jgi:glyoxylase-like metal-dependent hydrolase (beta-lactamase superfamily II)
MTLFKQLFDAATFTYTYVLADAVTRDAILIDPVQEHTDEYIGLIEGNGLTLRYILETHVHADHVTAVAKLKARYTEAKSVVSEHGGAPCADVKIKDGDMVVFGNEVVRVLATPGHTPGCVSYQWRDRVFTGDALLIGGCGRTDFQGGDAGRLYDSITGRIFTLAPETLIFPGHDYNGRFVSNVAQEMTGNPRLAGKSRDEFIAIMNQLDLPKPKLIDVAVPANQQCGRELARAA